MKRLVCWFSCGAASAVATKICLSKYAKTHEIIIARLCIANEHEDNERFAKDCEKWFGQKIITLENSKWKDCWDVWETKRYLASTHGAPCTTEMKRIPAAKFVEQWDPDEQAYGYTAEEKKRADAYCALNPDVKLITPLIDEYLNKSNCLAMLSTAGIKIPQMYRLGFNNNNCIGCVKGGMGYWNRIRMHFPDIFDRMAKLERKIGYAILGVYLDELPEDAGRHVEPEIDCSLLCYRAELIYIITEAL